MAKQRSKSASGSSNLIYVVILIAVVLGAWLLSPSAPNKDEVAQSQPIDPTTPSSGETNTRKVKEEDRLFGEVQGALKAKKFKKAIDLLNGKWLLDFVMCVICNMLSCRAASCFRIKSLHSYLSSRLYALVDSATQGRF
jgi:hypothetical protein